MTPVSHSASSPAEPSAAPNSPASGVGPDATVGPDVTVSPDVTVGPDLTPDVPGATVAGQAATPGKAGHHLAPSSQHSPEFSPSGPGLKPDQGPAPHPALGQSPAPHPVPGLGLTPGRGPSSSQGAADPAAFAHAPRVFGDVEAFAAAPAPRTLAVDCGGGGIKTALFDAAGFQLGSPQRTAVRYPFSPTDLLAIVGEHAATFDGFERITLGMPGMIRHGIVVYTPHYIRRSGPHTKIEPELATAWGNLDMEASLRAQFGVPALVLNDAEVAAAGVVTGEGCELVLTLGTGLGSALVDDGRLAPHLEMSHAQMRWGLTYDDVVGESERMRLGDSAWSRRVLRAIDTLWPIFRWDHLYIGGGNSSRISTSVRAKLGDNVVIIPNAAGMNGGVRAWSMAKPGRSGAR